MSQADKQFHKSIFSKQIGLLILLKSYRVTK